MLRPDASGVWASRKNRDECRTRDPPRRKRPNIYWIIKLKLTQTVYIKNVFGIIYYIMQISRINWRCLCCLNNLGWPIYILFFTKVVLSGYNLIVLTNLFGPKLTPTVSPTILLKIVPFIVNVFTIWKTYKSKIRIKYWNYTLKIKPNSCF